MAKLVPGEGQIPVLMIQCDWEDLLFTLNKEVWVSCKFRGAPSIQGRLKNRGLDLPASVSEHFIVQSCSKDAIAVAHAGSKHSCTFLPAVKQFSIHTKGIHSLDVSEGGFGVSACREKLQVWDTETGHVRRELKGHVGDVYAARLFPSGVVVLSAGADMRLKIWSAETGQCPVTLQGHRAAVTDVAIVEKGRNVVSTAKDGSARLWDCGQASCLAVLVETSLTLNCCAIGTLHSDFKLQPRVEQTSEREIGTEQKLLCLGSEEGKVLGVDMFTRQKMFEVDVECAVNVVVCLSETALVVGCQDGRVLVYNPLKAGAQPERVIHETNSPVLSACPYNQGVFIGHNDGMVVYYDCTSWSNSRLQLTGSDCDPVYSIACTKNTVYTACRDGKIRKYRVKNLIESLK